VHELIYSLAVLSVCLAQRDVQTTERFEMKRETDNVINYNACKLGDSEPVTIGFSDAVGEILVTNLTVASRKPNFKYYI
jgi:hypothetical protein